MISYNEPDGKINMGLMDQRWYRSFRASKVRAATACLHAAKWVVARIQGPNVHLPEKLLTGHRPNTVEFSQGKKNFARFHISFIKSLFPCSDV